MPSARTTRTPRSGVSKNKTQTTKPKPKQSKFAFFKRHKVAAGLIIGFAAAIACLVGFASGQLTEDLNINGSATVKSLNWSVYFDHVSEAIISGRASETAAPTLSYDATKIGDYAVILHRPGDAVAYDFDVVNEGDVDAEITSVTINTGSNLTCTSSSNRASTICDNLRYTLTYNDGSAVSVGDPLLAGGTRKMTIKLTLASTLQLEELPNADVEVSGLEVVITYGQKQ